MLNILFWMYWFLKEKIHRSLDIWKEQKYFSKETIAKLKIIIQHDRELHPKQAITNSKFKNSHKNKNDNNINKNNNSNQELEIVASTHEFEGMNIKNFEFKKKMNFLLYLLLIYLRF